MDIGKGEKEVKSRLRQLIGELRQGRINLKGDRYVSLKRVDNIQKGLKKGDPFVGISVSRY